VASLAPQGHQREETEANRESHPCIASQYFWCTLCIKNCRTGQNLLGTASWMVTGWLMVAWVINDDLWWFITSCARPCLSGSFEKEQWLNSLIQMKSMAHRKVFGKQEHEKKDWKLDWTTKWVSQWVNEWVSEWVNEMKWNEMKWDGMKWNEMRWNEMGWNEMRWDEMRWDEMRWNEINEMHKMYEIKEII
jgi:hypothetical protein